MLFTISSCKRLIFLFSILFCILSLTHETQILNHQEKKSDALINNAAKSIIDYLLAESADLSRPVTEIYTHFPPEATTTTPAAATTTPETSTQNGLDGFFSELDSSSETSNCKPMESCFISNGSEAHEQRERSTSSVADEKPMTLKLDSFHALDPQLQQANQMKLSQLNSNNLETYRLLNTPELSNSQQQQQQQQQRQQNQFQQPFTTPPQTPADNSKSEMLISFEQAHSGTNLNPISALATSQVLKLCSCTCQTMTPVLVPPGAPNPTQIPYPTQTSSQSLPHSSEQTGPPEPTATPTLLPPPLTTMTPTITTQEPTTSTPETPVITETEIPVPPTTSEAPPPTEAPTTEPQTVEPTTMQPPPPPTQEPTSATTNASLPATPPHFFNYCNQVEWVKPNKTVYASARIVWDVDRGSQNYFICNNLINNELVPGKTHGFSCKLSSEGRALEMHNFNVLTKPENVNLAWVQRNSDTFGKTNLPVVGGYSKNQDPYIVSRCLVRDENNDVLSLIGYVNNQGNGWFPFDDIQIECAQYDVLACIN